MTATPIPRTLALTAYGDLDVTALHELPAGRKPVATHAVDGAAARARAYERAREEIRAGRQVFVVCPLVSESEALQAKAATTEAEHLARTEFRDHRVELIHGQMSAKQKAEAMGAFAAGDADVLVATSVIEVGIDVPNAGVMMIEAAERYGISQLHQLRGRIGRGEHPGLCILFGDPGLPRLNALMNERDGFRLAEVDLHLRGAGEVLGTRQHGLPQFRVARIPEDADLLSRARDRAEAILSDDPELKEPQHVLLREAAAAPLRIRTGPDTGVTSPAPPSASRHRQPAAAPMRVVAGQYRGRRLHAPRGTDVRPTSDRVREALFSILGDITGLRVLDLFAGSGALAIEALSRGAASATLVENNRSALDAIRANLAPLEDADAEVVRADAVAWLGGGRGPYDLVFADPPYSSASSLAGPLSDALPAVLSPNALIVSESDKRDPLMLAFPLEDERAYGHTRIAIHRAAH